MAASHSIDTDRDFYRPIQGSPFYLVGRDGSIWSCKGRGPKPGVIPWTQVKTRVHNGYRIAKLSVQTNIVSTFAVHRLVLEAFSGPCPHGMCCRHLDGNRANNSAENLRWGTVSENAADRKLHGTEIMGVATHNAKFTDDDIRSMRQRRANGERVLDLASEYGIHKVHMSKILNRHIWRHVQ